MPHNKVIRTADCAGTTGKQVWRIVPRKETRWERRIVPAQFQAKLGTKGAVAFDIWGACSGWLYALNIARGLILSGQIETALCIATEKMSAITDWTDRATCVLFGDAAGAAVVQRSDEEGRGILASYMRSDGTLAELLHRRPIGPSSVPIDVAELTVRDGHLRMAGREVFKNAVRSMCEAVEQAGVRHAIGFNYRRVPAVRLAKMMIELQRLG